MVKATAILNALAKEVNLRPLTRQNTRYLPPRYPLLHLRAVRPTIQPVNTIHNTRRSRSDSRVIIRQARMGPALLLALDNIRSRVPVHTMIRTTRPSAVKLPVNTRTPRMVPLRLRPEMSSSYTQAYPSLIHSELDISGFRQPNCH